MIIAAGGASFIGGKFAQAEIGADIVFDGFLSRCKPVASVNFTAKIPVVCSINKPEDIILRLVVDVLAGNPLSVYGDGM